MVRDSVQLETIVNTISYEYLLDFTLEYGIPETLHLELPGPGDRIVDFPKGKVALLKEQVSGEEKLKPHLSSLSSMRMNRWNNAISGRRWIIGNGLRLAMMKCAESLEMRQAFADVVSAGVAKGMSKGLKHGVEHGQARLTVESIEAYDPEAEAKFVAALQSLKDLKYHLLDQLEGLKDAPMDVIMAGLYLESDTGGMLRNIYATSVPAHHPHVPGVCRTHGVGSAHHARSDGVPVSVPTVVPQGLALLLVDAATQTDLVDA
nr:transposase (putative), gypsy type [Tanacetum cinerariifolium]